MHFYASLVFTSEGHPSLATGTSGPMHKESLSDKKLSLFHLDPTKPSATTGTVLETYSQPFLKSLLYTSGLLCHFSLSGEHHTQPTTEVISEHKREDWTEEGSPPPSSGIEFPFIIIQTLLFQLKCIHFRHFFNRRTART